MKKMSASAVGFIIALTVIVLTFVVYNNFIKKKSYYLIDNPSKATINVKIDQQDYIISPGQQVEIQLDPGDHNLSVQSEVDSLNYPSSTFNVAQLRGLINPTRSVYFIHGMPYGPNVNKDSIYSELKANYKGKTFIGDIEIDSTIYNEDFYYNLNEKYPKLTLKSENSQLRKKIFRESDFKQFYFENYE